MNNSASVLEQLVIKRVFKATIERVFDAWTKPEMLAKWFGPEGFSVNRSKVQLTVGGSFEIEIISPDGKHIRHFGNYLEISKPNNLVFTWILADQDCSGSESLNTETMVSIQLKSLNQITELTLTHEQLPSKSAYDGHKFGWTGSLNSLNNYLK